MLYVDRAPSARPEPFSVRFLSHSKKTKSERAAIAAAILGQWARSLWPDGCPNRSRSAARLRRQSGGTAPAEKVRATSSHSRTDYCAPPQASASRPRASSARR